MRRMNARRELGARLFRFAPAWQPKAMAAICFASALTQVYGAVFPVRDHLDLRARLVGIALTAAAGAVYWLFARHFRVWMVHAIIGMGLLWGLLGLSRGDNVIAMVVTLSTILWTCILVALAFPPRVTRGYAAFLCVGLAVAISANGVESGAEIGLLFGGSFIVTMEILTRMSTRLRQAATVDALTGFLNRPGLEREVGRVRSFRRGDDRVSVLLVDLDDFKQLNDRHGHLEADRRLSRFGEVWRANLRAGEIVGRLGGDEFVVVSAETDEAAAAAMAERLRGISTLPWSGGLVISEPGETFDSILARADRLLYAEKTRKRGADPAGATAERPVLRPGAASASGRSGRTMFAENGAR